MLFNSYTFIAFFAIVLFLHNLPISWRAQKFNLLIASYIFYAAWNPAFVLLIWFSTLVDWFVAKRIPGAEGRRRQMIVSISLVANLGLLGFFKYGDFLSDNVAVLLAFIGIVYEPVDSGIVLPVGISFYTFQTLSYTLDVYRGRMKPCSSFLDYALYVTFFPQLVAGPIVRAVDFLPQCETRRRSTGQQMYWGLVLLILGLFQKIVVADALLGPQSDKVYAHDGAVGFLDAWLGTFAFSGQVFCDFAGYSTCAIGVAMCLGFKIRDNFKFPFAAIGFSDLWRRWHVSLSSWLQDYLYISLGGNRRGEIRSYINLMITMLLGGLWHGAAWGYVVWGGLHGTFLIAERLVKEVIKPSPFWEKLPIRMSLAFLTYLGFCLAVVFFRAPYLSGGIAICQGMFGLSDASPLTLLKSTEALMVAGVTFLMLATHWILRDSSVEEASNRLPWYVNGALIAGMLVAITTMSGDSRAFIYFQF